MHWTPDAIRAMADRMETRPKGFRVSAATAPLVIEAVRLYAREHCVEALPTMAYAIDVWDRQGNGIDEHVALVRPLGVAEAAYEATRLIHPARLVTMRQGIRVVRSSER